MYDVFERAAYLGIREDVLAIRLVQQEEVDWLEIRDGCGEVQADKHGYCVEAAR